MTTAMVTGASAGLGSEYVKQLAATGWDVIVVARDAARLEEAAQRARGQGVTAEVFPADLGVRADVERVAERLRDPARPVDLLVNNAGMGTGRGFLESDLETQDRNLEVMVRALMVLTHAAGEAMVARGSGSILNVSSIAARTASGTYSAHKAWVDTFTRGLARRLRGTGVTATVVRPGLVRTEFHDRAGLDFSDKPSFVWLKTETVVRSSLRAAKKGRVTVIPSLRYKLAWVISSLLP
ncbi:MAG: SDR family NAD(P)-dependent oxidoreductase [Demequinaceae bacterium]|nr:SDR family NAD(P)-dependent oxidoreductase [Demequinaceae bacterium]